ncbi:hypothetical protein BVRB_041750 [Beta vulgaris subsp. vulgaris]|uniref:Uncharacterized protein n=1 Tax=Beta vulgaris subsp. vulgaris TaxID=3555 RepID=A0A0J7YMQ1_BETVV|nr:hypothetical protein BVRB_041750 [Beta vulgaris subsp. vulgaris]
MSTSLSPHTIAAVAFEDNVIRIFDTESALLLASLKGHRSQVKASVSSNLTGYISGH